MGVIIRSPTVANDEEVDVSCKLMLEQTDGSIRFSRDGDCVVESDDVTAGWRGRAGSLAWYCARTKHKREHIAAANLHRNLGLEVFHPRLRMERATQHGVRRVVEPLFPCYIFIRCVLEDSFDDIRHTSGVGGLVHFGEKIPVVSDSVIEELQECFEAEDPMTIEDPISPADEVVFVEGAFSGMRAFVLRVMPAKKRVQVLLDVLGRSTPVEVERKLVVLERSSLAESVPLLAAPHLGLAAV